MEKTAKAPPSQGSNIPRAEGQRLAKRLQGLYRGYTRGIQGVIALRACWFGDATGMSQRARRLSCGQFADRAASKGGSAQVQ